MSLFTSFVFTTAAALAACDTSSSIRHATATDRDEAELQISQCLDHPTCSAFLSCFCTIGSSSSGGSSSGGSEARSVLETASVAART